MMFPITAKDFWQGVGAWGQGLRAQGVPYLLMFGCGVIWGMTFSLARIATEQGGHPISLAFWVLLLSGLLLLGFCLVRGGLRALSFSRVGLTHSAVLAVFGNVLPTVLYFYTASRLPAGVLAITLACMPMLTYALSWVLGMDRFSAWRTFGVVLGFCAIALLMLPESSLPQAGMARWVWVALLPAVCYTVENIYVDARISRDSNISALLAVAMLLSALVLTPLVFGLDIFIPIDLPLSHSEIAMLTMAGVSCIAYLGYLQLIRISGAVFASMAGYLMTLSGVFWGMVFFAERHSGWVWAALAVMLLGMLLVTPREEAGNEA